MKIIVDMNLSPIWAGFLKTQGYKAQHWSDIGSVSAADAEIMKHALATNAVILTNDLDFGAILAVTGGNAPSVMQIRADDLSVAAIGSQIILALQQTHESLVTGALVTVEPSKTRLTILPILK